MSMANTLTFNIQDQYFVWRAEWRAAYKELSSAIRVNKIKAANISRCGDYAGITQKLLCQQRKEAFAMLELRAKSKIRAKNLRSMPLAA